MSGENEAMFLEEKLQESAFILRRCVGGHANESESECEEEILARLAAKISGPVRSQHPTPSAQRHTTSHLPCNHTLGLYRWHLQRSQPSHANAHNIFF